MKFTTFTLLGNYGSKSRKKGRNNDESPPLACSAVLQCFVDVEFLFSSASGAAGKEGSWKQGRALSYGNQYFAVFQTLIFATYYLFAYRYIYIYTL